MDVTLTAGKYSDLSPDYYTKTRQHQPNILKRLALYAAIQDRAAALPDARSFSERLWT